MIHIKTVKLDFDIVIERSDSDSDERHAFVMRRYKIFDLYKKHVGSWNMMTSELENVDVILSCENTTNQIIHGHLVWFMEFVTC